LPSDGRKRPPSPKILVDTNGWFLPVRAGTDLIGEAERLVPGAELLVPTPVLRELERLAGQRVKGAEIALGMARKVREFSTEGRGDAGVLEAATRSGHWVLTGDRALSGRLRAAGISVLVPRDRTRLVAHGPIDPRRGSVTVMKRPKVRTPTRRVRGTQ
jgi:rRNA-processing protein FCF1